jgi:UDP-N-acetylmuramyl tripeptide synthase
LKSRVLKSGILGTITYNDGVISEEAKRTTPEGSYISKISFSYGAEWFRACVMEVSSHGLSLGRLEWMSIQRSYLHKS